jgi:hypothetical protein
MKALALTLQKLLQTLMFFSKVWKSSRSRSKGQGYWYPINALATKNTNVNY